VILLGDCLERLKGLEDNSVDSVVTDPPYGLKFMGKKWDYDVPSVAVWKEVFRVLKPGGHLLSFGGTRTFHRLACAIEDAGFEIRDQIQWLYGSGFPKSHNVGNGVGTALKPANEPICLSRKPLEKGLTVASNVLKWGVGGLNIDESRVEASAEENAELNRPNKRPSDGASGFMTSTSRQFTPAQGRWPANVVLDEESARLLDLQSGLKIRGASAVGIKKTSQHSFNVGESKDQKGQTIPANDYGGASRFFYCAKASKRERNAGLEGMPVNRVRAYEGGEIASAKTPDSMGGRRTAQNHHPTVKPIKLMEYLIKLVTPKGGTVLDPFCGSGSTGVAAFKNGFKFIGIEMSPEYVEIAEKRIAHAST
jgi:predicted RNA methylase